MLQLLGVSKVAVYLTNSSRETEHILEYYTQKGMVQVIVLRLHEQLQGCICSARPTKHALLSLMGE